MNYIWTHKCIGFSGITSLCAFATIFLVASKANADDEFADIRTIQELPKTQLELKLAHQKSKSESCEIIAPGESVELTSFKTILTPRDQLESAKRRLSASNRLSALSVGIDILRQDRSTLPNVSGSLILDYLAKNYVNIQVRTRRDWLDRQLYFHHRPIAVTSLYRSSKLSQPFEPVIANSIHDFHSLGIFTPKTKKLTPQDCRTIVLLFKNVELISDGMSQDNYEFAFIRGREGRLSHKLDTHVFITTHARTRLSYMRPFIAPLNVNDCSIKGNVAITRYDSSGLYPKESATRSFTVNSKSIYSIDTIDSFCQRNALSGGFSGSLNEVLDAIIDNKLADTSASNSTQP